MIVENDGSFTKPSWDEYFLHLAEAVSARADCRRRKVGCVIVDEDHRVIGTGYNGAPSGHVKNDDGTSNGLSCLKGDCPRGMLGYDQVKEFSDYNSGPGRCIALHAEANALLYARTSCKNATVYVTDQPCPQCSNLLGGAKVSRVVWPEGEINYE